MSIKFSRLSIFLAASALTVAISTNAYAATRLSGSDRYETSAKIALSGWTTSDYAVLASGSDYPDALTAAPLAGKYKAPVLLAEKNSIPDVTLSTISSLGIKNIFIIGGTGVISTSVESKLTSLGITVTRLAGSNRYETSIKVAEQIGSVSEIFAVSGEEYADALSVAPIAVKNNMPIILVEKDSIPTEVTSYLATQNITKTYVIGKGTSITSDSSLPNVTEINGSDKYARNIAIISTFKSSLDFSTIYLATGENFADALSGSVLAGLKSNPLFLVGNDISATKSLIQLMAPEASIKILGGTGAVSDNTATDIDNSTTSSSITVTDEDNSTTSSSITVDTSVITKIKIISSKLYYSTSGTNEIASFNYKVYNQNGKDITKTVSGLTFSTEVGTITGSKGVAKIIVPTADDTNLTSIDTLKVTITDADTGVSTTSTLSVLAKDSSTTTNDTTTDNSSYTTGKNKHNSEPTSWNNTPILKDVSSWATTSTDASDIKIDTKFQDELDSIKSKVEDIESQEFSKKAAIEVQKLTMKYNITVKEYKDWLNGDDSTGNGQDNNENKQGNAGYNSNIDNEQGMRGRR